MSIENNKLIAEFMGDGKEYEVDINTKTLKSYNNSWDWLIPVIKKIDSYACEEMDFSDYDDYRNKYMFIHNISLHNDIREVYNQAVEFINEFNKN